MIVGVDPGVSGAMVLYDPDNKLVIDSLRFSKLGKTFDHGAMHKTLRDWKAKHEISMVVIEKVHSMPRQGVASTFSFGMSFGMQIATVASHGLPYTLVTPVAWSREMHQGISPELEPKKRTEVAMAQLFPTTNFRGPRAQKHHSGLSDALMLAEFWRRKSERTGE